MQPQIIKHPDPRLLSISQDVRSVDASVHMLIHQMTQAMYANKGQGLAAIQIGVPARVIMIDVPKGNPPQQYGPLVLINPVFNGQSKEMVTTAEGCLSFPGEFVEVERHKWVDIFYFDRIGAMVTCRFEGEEAICVQHEMDHLMGITLDAHKSNQRKALDTPIESL